jgi:uncharacterized membrane protein YedE/YeeE
MEGFTPASALAGGLLIGSAAILLLWLTGRIAGISSIVGGLVGPSRRDVPWRLAFLIGLVAGVAAWQAWTHQIPSARPAFPAWLLIVAGLLVGFGTSLGSGCTSGHGVCGLGRFSVRSLAATATFLVVGIATTFVVRHVFGVF